ncbi:expressed unknown protein [Seminavis robusta]|uniref:RING-type domain-containing protein n=1 Tax=Seminavis robusta TaxID=568900 RepID=A0A9N8E3W9_9STRA|nr:expressed unknown protein [Seminavis robusta]|eukprot:Sro477_g150671.1  (100) ;mRNA; r:8554-8853
MCPDPNCPVCRQVTMVADTTNVACCVSGCDFTDGSIVALFPCKHMCCSGCVNDLFRYFERKPNSDWVCPVCRANVEPMEAVVAQNFKVPTGDANDPVVV